MVSTVFFSPTWPKVDVVSRFIPFIADNFVRLASPATKRPLRIRRLPYKGGGRGEEAQFNRGNRAIFPAIVPSFLPLAPPRSTIENPQPDRSNRERGRVIFASTWCNFTKFHDRISRFICKRGSFFWWLLIGFYFVNFFLRRGGGGGGEKERISFRKFDESWCKIDIRGFFFVFFFYRWF